MSKKTKEPPMEEKYTLITNLTFVILNGVRTHTSALLICSSPGGFFTEGGTRHQLRGFGTDPAWPVFDFELSSPEYTLEKAESSHVLIKGDGDAKPLFTGGIMQMKNGPKVDLIAEKPGEIHFETFSGDKETILRVWSVLPLRVAQYWNAPHMPRLRWGPP